MATRFYLPASGTPPLASLGVESSWEQSTGLTRLPTFTTKQNTALATSTRTWPSSSTQQWVWWQFQTETLDQNYTFNTSNTISMVIGKCAETTNGGDTHLAFILKVVNQDGSSVRGVLLQQHAAATEFALVASAATRIHNALAFTGTVNAIAGDRLVLELGVHGVTPAAENIQMRIGDPTGTADFALTEGLTTDLDSWWEISNNVSFGTFQPVNTRVWGIPTNPLRRIGGWN